MDLAKCGKHSSEILLYLLRKGESPITSFNELKISPPAYYRTIRNLEESGLVKRKEAISKRKIVYVSLTEKGMKIADQLRMVDYIEKGDDAEEPYQMPLDLESEFKGLSALVHFNVKDDHIAIAEHNYDGSGKYRIVYVYTKPNGHNIMRLWCEVDQTFECPHTKYAWTLPDVQAMIERVYADRMTQKKEL